MTTKAQRAADRVFERGLAKWLGRLETSETISRDVHNRIAQRLSRELRGQPASAINRIIERTFRSFERERVALIRDTVAAGAHGGSGLTRNVARAVFGDAGAREALRPLIDDRAALQRRITARHMNGDLTVDRQSVRDRLRTRTSVVANRMAAEVQESLRLGETTTQTAERMLRTTDITVRLPRYIQDIRAAAHTAEPSLVRATVRKHAARLEDGRIQEHNIARETRRFVRSVRQAEGADIDRAVEQWVRGRAQNQAMTIARTEGQGALAEAYVESTRSQPWVKGYRWNLSPAHRRPDICDVMAGQDLHGLGPGGYPAEDVPSLAHPNDLCFFTAIIDEHHIDRERARVRGHAEPPSPWVSEGNVTARDWLGAQSAEQRRAILGPGRAAEFERRPTRVVNADGSLNPLWAVQGRQPPAPPAGERFVHRAEGRVERLGKPPARARTSRG